MATMIPENVEVFKTEGEMRFYKFLEKTAKPDNSFLVWYTPDIRGKEPDFLVYSDKIGLIIFEVKDWAINQILQADPHHFVLQMGNKENSRKNPMQQAGDYKDDLMDKIKADGRLIATDPAHHGNVKIPINCGVVLPNINKFDYLKNGFGTVMSERKIIFWDDLDPSSDICMDESGKSFQKAVTKNFAPQFRFSISHREFNHLRQLIFPVVKIDLPDRGKDPSYDDRLKRLKMLDHNQEALARKFDGGHRIIAGPSGCGKTLILVHKAAFLKQYNPEIDKILFVCYNITLVNYIKRLLAAKKLPMGTNGVTVCHFFELCENIIGEDVAFEKEESEYYEMVLQEALANVQDFAVQYDAILVDEGHDFSGEMLKLVTSLLNPKTNNLTIALDNNQSIYRKKRIWKDSGSEVQGRVHKLACVYRNTVEIAEFASRFISNVDGAAEQKTTGQRDLFAGFSDFHGPLPRITQFRNFDEIIDDTALSVEKIITSETCPLSEVAVLYAMKNPGKILNEPLPSMIMHGLESRGILSNWISEDYKSKKSYDISTDSVTISTIHSVKGLDYSVVFLLGLDFLEPKSWSEEQIEKLIYVAITRARCQLFIPYVAENQFISKLKSCL